MYICILAKLQLCSVYFRVTSVRHCILMCNSPPYHMAAEESSDYSGYNSEQLASMMGKVVGDKKLKQNEAQSIHAEPAHKGVKKQNKKQI